MTENRDLHLMHAPCLGKGDLLSSEKYIVFDKFEPIFGTENNSYDRST